MKKLLFLMMSLFFVIGCGGGGGTTDLTTDLTPEYPYDTLLAIPTVDTIQGGTFDAPTPLNPIDLESPDPAVTHKFGADVSNNYFEYAALAGETLIIAITFDVPLSDDEMLQLETASPGFLEVYDSQLELAAITHDGGSESFTEVYMVYAIKFNANDTYLLRFGWEGHAGYATIAAIAP